MINAITHIIDSIPTRSLTDFNEVEFESRVDSKFVMPQHVLPLFLEKVKQDLVVLEVGGKTVFNYNTRYFDSAEFDFFKNHHSGYGNRSKVRVRQYDENGPVFFEVKNKNNRNQTIKFRQQISDLNTFDTDETAAILKERTGFTFSNLPKLTDINYQRISFAHHSFSEKLTIDFGLSARVNGSKHQFENLVIVEVKQSNYSSRSSIIRALKELKIYKTSFSKYCISQSFLNSNLKKNRFLPIIKTINNIASA